MPKTDAHQTPTQFIADLPEPRRQEVRALHRLVRKAAPKLKPAVDGAFLTYGTYHYVYPSGREGDSFIVGIANLKGGISLYVQAHRGDQWLPEAYGRKLGNVSCGKSCVRITSLDKLDMDAAAEMIAEAARTHGKA